MMKIILHGAEFFAHHGFYPEEQKLGNVFVVDIEAGFSPKDHVNDLADTVNYEKLYDIACEQMKITRVLLETVAQEIMNDIISRYTYLDSIEVTVKKMNPPLGHKVQYSAVTLTHTKA